MQLVIRSSSGSDYSTAKGVPHRIKTRSDARPLTNQEHPRSDLQLPNAKGKERNSVTSVQIEAQDFPRKTARCGESAPNTPRSLSRCCLLSSLFNANRIIGRDRTQT